MTLSLRTRMLAGGPQNIQQANMDFPTEKAPCSSDTLEYIWQYRMSQIRAIQRKLRVFDGVIDVDDAIYVTARRDGMDWAKQMVNELIGKVVCDRFEIVQPGITTFFAKGKMDSLLDMVENKEKCLVRVKKRTHKPSIQPSGFSLNSSTVIDTGLLSTDMVRSSSAASVSLSADSSVVFVTPQGHKLSWKIGDIATEQVC